MTYSFDTDDAIKYGVDEAIILNHLKFWMAKNIANQVNLHEGLTWTYNSVDALKMIFPFWKPGKIQRLLTSLETQQKIKSGNFNKMKYDRTKWYSVLGWEPFAKNGESNFKKWRMDSPELANRTSKNGEPIPDTLTYSIPYIKETPISPSGNSPQKTKKLASKKTKPKDQLHDEAVASVKIPENLDTLKFISTWSDFTNDRKVKKQFMTAKAVELSLKKLSRYPVEVAITAINKTIANGWRGLFPENVEQSEIEELPTGRDLTESELLAMHPGKTIEQILNPEA